MIVKLLMVAEVEVPDGCDEPTDAAHDKLDCFRESVVPSQNHGITLYCVKAQELSEDLALHGKEVCDGE